MRERILKLTNAAYKLLEFFPESDPLKIRAKDRALAIMENSLLLSEKHGGHSDTSRTKAQAVEDIDALLGYLWMAKAQGWLNSSNCLIISNEYENIKRQIIPIKESVSEPPEEVKQAIFFVEDKEDQIPEDFEEAKEDKVKDSVKLTERQENILEFLKRNEKAQVMDLQKVLPDVTKRTIRRDLDELLRLGQIIRMGDFNQIFYKINIKKL